MPKEIQVATVIAEAVYFLHNNLTTSVMSMTVITGR